MIHFYKTFLVALSLATFFNNTTFNHTALAAESYQNELAAPSALVKKLVFRNDMRKLWEDHITWTRLYLVSAIADLPDKDETAKRLLQNQVDIGDAIKPFYGNEGGDKLTGLLKEHIMIAVNLVTLAKANDTIKVKDAQALWYSNANDIATFLNTANPKNWLLEDAKKMMKEHLDLTSEELGARLKSDWPTDIASYDKIHLQVLKMADMLSNGIIKQFPKKFKN